MCGHGGLLVNVVFSLTGIFHGSAGGMSSGHTWHWGTPERSYQIPLGKPGLVIPRCETLASRSVTFPLHQRESTALHPLHHPLFLAMRICNWGSKGKKECTAKKGEGALLTPPPTTTTAAKLGLKKSAILSVPLLKLLLRTMRLFQHSWRSPTRLHSQVKNHIVYLCSINITGTRSCVFILSTMHLGVYSKGFRACHELRGWVF